MSANETDAYYLLGILVRFLQRSPDTGGAYSLVESICAPGAGAPPNRHAGDDEAFYVVDGEFEFHVAGKDFRATTGDFVRVPPGAIHAFKNVGTAPARLLVMNTPGVVHDGFFSQAGEPMPPGTRELPDRGPENPDIPRLIEIARRNGLEIILPSGGSHD